MRGARTFGRGYKKGRGAGLRGGRGGAGWKHKKLHFMLYEPERLRGKHGFTRHAQDAGPEPAVTLQAVDEQAEAWLAAGKARREGEALAVDLGALGFAKLLGTGRATRKLRIQVAKATPGAVRKVEAAGGSVAQTLGAAPAPPEGPEQQG